ncbi:sigma-70 family RNA polymerase sigma factor [Streptomyces thermoviolaceus subsp. thermoviolaceus]|uniref:Sigma-70 family RNA polymerase sigma factor n=1 Tax=Streptomyces thermoviolaceus subsp. thermoviolaceus TaxID=66860 RepID=A0ABX0YTE1_STRTL|nr:sigma-70 family RNA polymerase sigma factor [Streptomyces thermoviolaceus subsp. thermoviolaceus]
MHGLPVSSRAFDELARTFVAGHRRSLVAYAEKLLGDPHLAEDIVQETFVRALPHVERLHATRGSVRGWLLTVTRNLVIDRQRRAAVRRESVSMDFAEPVVRDHVDEVLAAMDSVRLLRALSAEHREVLVHTYMRDQTLEQTAKLLGVPTGTVKSRQHYALRKLRARLEVAGQDTVTSQGRRTTVSPAVSR